MVPIMQMKELRLREISYIGLGVTADLGLGPRHFDSKLHPDHFALW